MPTPAEIDLGVRLQALLVAAGFGGGGGGAAPLATNVLTGTVKTDVLELDPVVYVKASVDSNFYTKTAADARYALAAHVHAAADVTSGVFGHARLGSGGGGATKYLREDGSWQSLVGLLSLDNLSDVVITSVSDGDMLFFDGPSAKFINIAQPFSIIGHTHPISDINPPVTTLAGYGITNAYTKVQSDAQYSAIGHTHTFASLTLRPTTIGGYGITDFNSLGDARWALLAHVHAGTDITTGLIAPARLGSGSGGATKFLREDQSFQALPGAAVAIKTAEVDFGARAVREGKFLVADATVAAAQKIIAWQSGEAATGRDADEHEFASFIVVPSLPVAGVGFTAYLRDSVDFGELQGKHKLNYLLG
jgi:hypothetical protein